MDVHPVSGRQSGRSRGIARRWRQQASPKGATSSIKTCQTLPGSKQQRGKIQLERRHDGRAQKRAAKVQACVREKREDKKPKGALTGTVSFHPAKAVSECGCTLMVVQKNELCSVYHTLSALSLIRCVSILWYLLSLCARIESSSSLELAS